MSTSSRNYAVAVVMLSLKYFRNNHCDLWSPQTQHTCASDEVSDLLIALRGVSYAGSQLLGEFRPVPLTVSVDCTRIIPALFPSIPSQAFSYPNSSQTELRMEESRDILVSGQ